MSTVQEDTWRVKLDKASEQIRMIQVSPGTDSTIQCDLRQIDYKNETYCCLSYCWGSDEASHDVVINGSAYKVRTNFHGFLKTLRKLRIQRLPCQSTVWIDAICIDQTDEHERAAQIGIMGEIYKKAAITYVWLNLSHETMEPMYKFWNATIETIIKQNRKAYTPHEVAFDEYMSDLLLAIEEVQGDTNNPSKVANFLSNQTSLINKLLKISVTLNRVLENPYWTRAWIVQELLLSTDPRFLCSKRNMPATHVVKLLLLVQNFVRLERSLVGETCRVNIGLPNLSESFTMANSYLLTRLGTLTARMSSTQQNIDLDEALSLTEASSCKNPRDRIYSIRSLLPSSQQMTVLYPSRNSHDKLFHHVLKQGISSAMSGAGIHRAAVSLFRALEMSPTVELDLDTKKIISRCRNTTVTPMSVAWAYLRKSDFVDRSHAAREQRVALYAYFELEMLHRVLLEFRVLRQIDTFTHLETNQWIIETRETPRSWLFHKNKTIPQEGRDFGFADFAPVTRSTHRRHRRLTWRLSDHFNR